MASWLFVIGDRDALEWVLAQQAMAFRDHIRASRIADGDQFALYTTRGCYKNPTQDRAEVIATGTVVGDVDPAPVKVIGENFNQTVRFRLDAAPRGRRDGLPFAPLVSKLQFIPKKTAWMAYVRKSLVPIPDKDLKLVAKKLSELP